CAACASSAGGRPPVKTVEGEPQNLKTPPLRSAYSKIGMFGMPGVPFFQAGDNGFKGDQVRGFGFLHDGSVDTLFRFHNATVFNAGFANDTQRRQVEQFMFAFDSDLAPIVGQQITLTSTNSGTVSPRILLMRQRAAVGECDIVVKGNVSSVQRGWVCTGSNCCSGTSCSGASTFQSDRSGETETATSLAAKASASGQELTYTAVPVGSGTRIGIDRDGD